MEENARQILLALNEAGYEAYIVGGAVRDLLMHKTPHDYDITTSARPEEIRAVAEKAGWHTVQINGEAFGIVVVVVGQLPFEVATFRGEAYGEDSHRPNQIWYAQSLREDVLRRDFTVNALAMNAAGHIYDYVGGQKDLKKKRLVTVGDPVRRFQEDALRLFRACRFAGQLDFLADKALVAAMPQAFGRVAGLSLQRVSTELDRLLLTPAAYRGLDILVRTGLAACSCRQKVKGIYHPVPIMPELSHLVTTPQSKPFHRYDAWVHTLATVANTPADLTLRYAALLHDVAKGLPGIRGIHQGRYTDYGHDAKGAQMAEEMLLRLQKKPAFAKRVAWLVKTHMKFHFFANTAEGDVNKWLRQEALRGPFHRSAELVEAVEQATQVACGDILGCGYPGADTTGTRSFGAYMAELAAEMPVSSKDLHYDKRLPQLCQKKTGACLRILLKRVQNKDLANEAATLLEAASHWLERHKGDKLDG